MAARSDEWLDCFASLLPECEDTRALILDGSIEVCPCCWEMSAYAWQDATAYDAFPDGNAPAFFKPAPGSIAHIPVCGGDEWQCGHCGAHLVERDSPLLHPCYTHSED